MELSFRVFNLPVRVSLFFFLVGYLIRPSQARDVPALLAAWIAIMFAGVLLHELGHALTARRFGQDPGILLHGWGGVTYWTPRGTVGPGRRLLISAAGPAVGILLGGAFWLAKRLAAEPGSALSDILGFAVWVNLGWGVLNLLPILPLDGGQVLASFLEILGLANGRRAVHWFSLVMAAVLVVIGLISLSLWAILMGALLGYTNYMALRPPRPDPPIAPPADDPRFRG